MATAFKRKRTYPIPDGAERVTFRGKPYAKWTDKKGKPQRAPLNEAGNRIVVASKRYTIEYFDHTGKRRKVGTKYVDKDAALQYAAQLEKAAQDRENGMIDPKQERFTVQAQRPIEEHLADFRDGLAAKGNTVDHVQRTTRHVRQILDTCHVQQIGDLNSTGVLKAIRGIRDSGMSLRTCNAYLRSIKSFTRWLRHEQRSQDDPLAGLRAFNESTDKRHIRRELSADEIQWLLTVTEQQDRTNYNLDGQTRAMAYRVALGTGFRRRELRSLTPASFDLDADPPTVTVPAAYSKRRREDVQPIRRDLAELLGRWLEGFQHGDQLFPLPHNTSKMFRRDLAAARQAWIDAAPTDEERQRREASDFLRYEDSAGRFADFHATRHTYISNVVAGGASVKTAQELARHSDPRLTIGRYSHARLHDLTGALDALPDLQPQGSNREALQATGTDPRTPVVDGQQIGQQYSGKTAHKLARRDNQKGGEPEAGDAPQVVAMTSLGNTRQEKSEVVRGGVEPPTPGFSVPCSTN